MEKQSNKQSLDPEMQRALRDIETSRKAYYREYERYLRKRHPGIYWTAVAINIAGALVFLAACAGFGMLVAKAIEFWTRILAR